MLALAAAVTLTIGRVTLPLLPIRLVVARLLLPLLRLRLVPAEEALL